RSTHNAQHTTHSTPVHRAARHTHTHTHTHAEDFGSGNCPLLFTHPELSFFTGSSGQLLGARGPSEMIRPSWSGTDRRVVCSSACFSVGVVEETTCEHGENM